MSKNIKKIKSSLIPEKVNEQAKEFFQKTWIDELKESEKLAKFIYFVRNPLFLADFFKNLEKLNYCK